MSTPWSSSGSLPSDRIKPRHTSQPQPKKQKQKPQAAPPKSKQLTALESLLHAVQSTSIPVPDPKGGCFCQAKEHPLSLYTPACLTCGLVLCGLNPPQHACPHCHHPPAPRTTESTIVRLEREIGELRRREEEARERARKAVGAFPALGGGGGGSGRATPPSQHRVLSVNSKTKKVTVSSSSYSSTPTPVASRPGTPEPLRVPPPPTEVVYAKRKVDPSRPYANYGGGAARYVPDKIKGKGRGGETGPS
ncbi:hypothetical protein IW262DRAFT_658697 [Armillaria fumosa]|nr:hypothetical protein IW262DRAFT_658697 [Armillaria fumosa]